MLPHTQGQALPATCIYATIQCFKTAYMPSLQGQLCCIYAMMHWRWIIVYTSTLYILISISASIYAAKYASPSFHSHLHICYHTVFYNSIYAKFAGPTVLYICYDALAVDTHIYEYTVHFGLVF